MAVSELFCPCIKGLAPAVRSELAELGAEIVAERAGGVGFRGDRRVAYAANLWLRAAIRVQELLLEADVRDADDVYRAAGELDWSRYVRPDQTLAVHAAVRDSPITHSKFAALRVKDAVVDQMRSRHGRRPSVDVRAPDLPLRLVVRGRRAALYRDLSGGSLHKRGWRPVQVKSPLNEALAAGMLILGGWDRASPLVDPMCGSGTLPVEAALMAARRAPGLSRRFAFEAWPDHDRALWEGLRAAARRAARETLPFLIEGADRHAGALALAREGARRAGVDSLVRLRVADVAGFEPVEPPGVVAVNPPYGRRIGRGEDLADSWRALGRFLKERAPGAAALVLSGDRELTRHLGLKADRRWVLMNGPIECRLLRYRIHGRSDPHAPRRGPDAGGGPRPP